MAKKAKSAEPKLEIKNPSTVWTGTLSLGLISIPVKLHAAARGETISFNMLHADCLGRVKMKTVCPSCDVEIGRDETLKGYEYAKDQYVVVSKEELEAIEPESSKLMEFSQFVKASEIDPMLYETSYFVSPGDGGLRGYHLMRKAMIISGRVGITQVTMHGREQLVVVRPYGAGLALHTMYYAAEVRSMMFPADQLQASEKELKLAGQLIDSYATPFVHAAYKDTYVDSVKDLISAKLQGKQPAAPKKIPPKKTTTDLLEALEASLAASKRKAAGKRGISLKDVA